MRASTVQSLDLWVHHPTLIRDIATETRLLKLIRNSNTNS